MGKTVHNDVLDAALNVIKTTADKMILCEGEPSSYADATATKASSGNKLGSVAISTSDFTLGDGDTSGRKIAVTAQSAVSIDSTGTLNHIAFVDDGSGGTLLYVTTCSSTAVTGGTTRDIATFDIEIRDPT